VAKGDNDRERIENRIAEKERTMTPERKAKREKARDRILNRKEGPAPKRLDKGFSQHMKVSGAISAHGGRPKVQGGGR
jgi:hypothetical protein